jgi:hypothetical protein
MLSCCSFNPECYCNFVIEMFFWPEEYFALTFFWRSRQVYVDMHTEVSYRWIISVEPLHMYRAGMTNFWQRETFAKAATACGQRLQVQLQRFIDS